MLTRDLISQSIPYVHLHDKVHHALQLMTDYHVGHLPVVKDDAYVGMVSEELLLHSDDDEFIEELHYADGSSMVQATDHFLKAVQVAVANKLTVVPIIEKEQLLGVATHEDLLRTVARFMSLHNAGALIVLEIESTAYSFAEISRIVETNDAQITQLNTLIEPETGIMQVTLRVSKLEVSDIIATFQRYEYAVKYYFGEELYENELRTNYDNLMNYLEI